MTLSKGCRGTLDTTKSHRAGETNEPGLQTSKQTRTHLLLSRRKLTHDVPNSSQTSAAWAVRRHNPGADAAVADKLEGVDNIPAC